jgi:ribosomal protein L37E
MTGCKKDWYQNSEKSCAHCGENATQAEARFIMGTKKNEAGGYDWDMASSKDSNAQKALCGCKAGFRLSRAYTAPASEAASPIWGQCLEACPTGTTPQTVALLTTTTAQTEADCNMCKENYYQNAKTTCASCGAGKKKAAAALVTGDWDEATATAALALCVDPTP